jgi:hypothetical protein
MVIKNRGEVIDVTEQCLLTIQFKDQSGTPINTDSYPQISIVQPDGTIFLGNTSVGVSQIETGRYSYLFTAPINGPLGVWGDTWTGFCNGFRLQQQFEFIVMTTEMPALALDGYVHLGDDPGFHYSQCAINNINKLVKMLRVRLNSQGRSKSTDSYGNVIYVSCDIFSIDTLITTIAQAISWFNEIPYFTNFSFEDSDFCSQFADILVQLSLLSCLAGKALIERGREHTLQDSGISCQPTQVSELLNSQWAADTAIAMEKIKYIKNSMRPGPLGLGVFGMNSGWNPAIRNLRFLRERRIL